jgi:TonB family protein
VPRRSSGARPFLPRIWPVILGSVAVVVVLALLGGKPRRRPLDASSQASVPARVTLDAAALREQPNPGSRMLRGLERDAPVQVLNEKGGWLEVESDEGERGFLPVDAVEREADRLSREKRARTILSFAPVYGVVAEETDVVLAPFPMAPRAGRLRPGDVVAIHAVDHAYFALRGPDGELAFVRSADVDLVPRDPTRPAIVPDQARAPRKLTVQDLEVFPEGSPLDEAGLAEAEAERAELELPPEEEGEGGEVLEPAVLRSKVSPVYPEEARRAGIQGSVILEVAIDAAGRVTEVQVVRGLPYGVSESAVEAVRRWHYRPARGTAGPVPSRKTVRVLYTLGR